MIDNTLMNLEQFLLFFSAGFLDFSALRFEIFKNQRGNLW